MDKKSGYIKGDKWRKEMSGGEAKKDDVKVRKTEAQIERDRKTEKQERREQLREMEEGEEQCRISEREERRDRKEDEGDMNNKGRKT